MRIKIKTKAEPKDRVVIFKDGMRLRIRPLTHEVQKVLVDHLSYMRAKFLATQAQREERGSYRNPHMEFTRVQCYGIGQFNNQSQLFTNCGFLSRIMAALKKNNINYRIVDQTPTKERTYETPRWSILGDYELRPSQEEALRIMLEAERGRIIWATGTGKSMMLELLCRLLPKSRIVISTRFNDVLDTIYGYIKTSVSGVGVYNGKVKKPGRHVTCCSIGCLNYALNTIQPNVLFMDEVHEAATPAALDVLSRFKYTRMFGLSANEDDRADNADFELEGIFGKVLHRLSYQEGVEQKIIVPIDVHWRKVKLKRNPAKRRMGVSKARAGIWRNKARNKMIAKDAGLFPDDQVLITVKTVEHAVHLGKYLPDFTLVYAQADEDKIQAYKSRGLLPANYKMLDKDDRRVLRKKFESGKLRKVIATSVWNRGVNFKELAILIRAEGSSSTIDSTQIPGRLSRISEKTGKKNGILIDYDDVFDTGLERRSKTRRKDYATKGWKQIAEGQEGHFANANVATPAAVKDG